MDIIRGKIAGAQKVVIYGPEGIGKSTFAAQFPDPLFIDTEGSTSHMDVARFPKPSSWTMLLGQINYIKTNPNTCRSLIIDTADWAEQLCVEHVCSKGGPNIRGIEDFGYGKGYTYLAEEYGRMLNQLSDLVEIGINVVITAHAQMRKFEQPDEMGAYDRWELKLQKKLAALVKEWADMVLFANYKTMVVNVDNQGAAKGKNKAQGGRRTLYTAHHVCWDAKNRHGLPDEVPFDYSSIAHLIPKKEDPSVPVAPSPVETPPPSPAPEPEASAADNAPDPLPVTPEPEKPVPAESAKKHQAMPGASDALKALFDLMNESGFERDDVQQVVADRGYYPKSTPIEKYDPEFIKGVLIGAWPQVYELIAAKRDNDIPF